MARGRERLEGVAEARRELDVAQDPRRERLPGGLAAAVAVEEVPAGPADFSAFLSLISPRFRDVRAKGPKIERIELASAFLFTTTRYSSVETFLARARDLNSRAGSSDSSTCIGRAMGKQ